MRNMKKITVVAALAAIIVGAILGTGIIGSTKEDGAMGIKNDVLVTSAAIPVIDEAVPERIETATFALG